MKRIRTALCLILTAVLLAGCAFLPSDSEPETPAPTDPLTGLALEWQGQRPVAVAIENSTASTTQWGLSSASVVLEALTEVGTSTELCLVYPALAATPKVGPVAAGQDIYWRLLVGQQPIPVQRGGGQFDQNFLDYYSIRAVDALEAGRTAFDCGSEWSNAPLWYTSGSAVSKVLDALSISAVLTESRVTSAASAAATSASSGSDAVLTVPALLPQEEDGKLPDATAPDAMNVQVCFDDNNATGFAYDPDSGLYRMLHADGTPQLDANNGQQAGFDNLLVLFSASELRDDGKTYDYDLSMGGGVWLNGGHLWQITWTQGTQSTLALYDSNGKPLNLPAGRSYIALLSSLTGQELLVQSSTGEALVFSPFLSGENGQGGQADGVGDLPIYPDGDDWETDTSPWSLEGNWLEIYRDTDEGVFDTAPEDADRMCFLPTDADTEGSQLPFTASYITPYPELNVEEADLFYQEGTPEVPFQTNQEWYATFTGEDGSRYAVTLEDEDTLALKFYLDGEESYMSLVSTVYFARQEAMG